MPRGRRALAGDTVQQDAVAVAGEEEGREEEVGQLPVAVGVGGPVEVELDRAVVDEVRAGGADEPGQLLRGLAAEAQEKEERAELQGIDLIGEDHPHRGLGLVHPQRPRQARAARHGAQDRGEGVALGRGWGDVNPHRRARSARSTGRPRSAPRRPPP